MKHLKILGLAAVAAMALSAFAASPASAGVSMLYNGTTTLGAGSKLDFSVPSGGSVNLVDTSGNSLDKCSTSTLKAFVLNSEGLLEIEESVDIPGGQVTYGLTWSGCTFTTKTIYSGFLEVLWNSGTTGTVRTNLSTEVTINTGLFGSCIYVLFGGTQVGTLTTASSGAATFDVNAVATRSGSNAACPATAKWTGTYTSTEPSNLRVEKE